MQVRQLILTASAFVIAGARPAHAQGSALVPGDSGLQSLVAEALARNPTVAQRQEAVRAATLRIRPAGSLPDPMLTVGVMDRVPRRKAIPSRQSSPGIACGPKSSYWRATESPRWPR